MPTIVELQRKLKSFDTFAKQSIKGLNPAKSLQTKWQSLFSEPLQNSSAASFVHYYRGMHNNRSGNKTQKQKKQSGGTLTGAPLDYALTPGANVSVYGRFPTEINTDMGSLRDLDVYFRDSLSAGCGTENSSLTVPVEMGSNQVGGRRSIRKSRSMKRNSRKVNSRKTSLRKNNANKKSMRNSRKHKNSMKGGDLLESLTRPFWATAPPSTAQHAYVSYTGSPGFASPNPVDHTWKYATSETTPSLLIPPSSVSKITTELSAMANPMPWQA
jgi:hypothetical protein